MAQALRGEQLQEASGLIEELTLRGFKSYTSQQTIKFTSGVNKISGRNASGKTTLLEAILFALFGEVPGVDKQDLVPLGGGRLHVSLVFRSPLSGKRARVLREGVLARKDGDAVFRTTELYLEVDGDEHPYIREKDVQVKLRELLGVGKRVFFNVVYAKQKEFIEILNPQKGRMDAILGLTTPTEVREELREVQRSLKIRGRIEEKPAIEVQIKMATEAIAEAEKLNEKLEEQRGYLSQQTEELGERLGDANSRVEVAEALEADFRQLEKRQSDLEVFKGRREDRERDLSELLESIGEQPGEVKERLQSRLASAQLLEERLRSIEESLRGERRTLDGEIAKLDHQITEHDQLKKQGVTVCPKCGQEIDYGLIEEDMKRWVSGLDDRKGRLADLEKEMKQTQEQVQSAQERRVEARQAILAFEDQLKRMEELRRAISQLDLEGRRLSSRIQDESEGLMQKTFDLLSVRLTSLSEGLELVSDRLRKLRVESAAIQGDLREAEALLRESERRRIEVDGDLKRQGETLESSNALLDQVVEYEAKIRAIDEIQGRYGEYERQLRDNTLRDLEHRTYRYFQRLTDQQVYSFCHIDRENYVLEVGPIGADRAIPAWRAGGGHESLFALSERLALLRVMGFPHLLILDEPTDAVDSENIPQMLEYVARSSSEIGQVILVTHHGYGEEEGVNLIRVRKVDGESRVAQESLRSRIED